MHSNRKTSIAQIKRTARRIRNDNPEMSQMESLDEAARREGPFRDFAHAEGTLGKGKVPTAPAYRILREPYSLQELIILSADNDGYVTGVIETDTDEMIDEDIDDFNDFVSEQLTGSTIGLSDISWKTVGADKGKIHLEVTGYVLDYFGFDNILGYFDGDEEKELTWAKRCLRDGWAITDSETGMRFRPAFGSNRFTDDDEVRAYVTARAEAGDEDAQIALEMVDG